VSVAVGISPGNAAVSPDNRLALVSNFGGNTISVIDVATMTVTGQITVGWEPSDIAFSPDGTRAYALAFQDETVWAIDVATRASASAPVALGRPASALAVTPDGGHVLTAGYGYLEFLAANPLQLLSTIAIGGSGPSDVEISADGVMILVSSYDANNVTVLLPSSVSGGVQGA
jgi:YVTN family beta-propeller protein